MPLWSSCVIGLQMSHRGLDAPLGSRSPTMVQMSYHKPCCHHLALQCHHVPDTSLGSGCPTTIQSCCYHRALLCHRGPAMSLGSRCHIRVWMSLHDPSTRMCAGHGVTIQLWPHEHAGTLPSSCAVMPQHPHHLMVPLQSSCVSVTLAYHCNTAVASEDSCTTAIQLCTDITAVRMIQLFIHEATVHPQTSCATTQLTVNDPAVQPQ